LVTGPTGSGKSTTLAAVIDEANRLRTQLVMLDVDTGVDAQLALR